MAKYMYNIPPMGTHSLGVFPLAFLASGSAPKDTYRVIYITNTSIIE